MQDHVRLGVLKLPDALLKQSVLIAFWEWSNPSDGILKIRPAQPIRGKACVDILAEQLPSVTGVIGLLTLSVELMSPVVQLAPLTEVGEQCLLSPSSEVH